MNASPLPGVLLQVGAALGLLTTYLFVATGIRYRHRDNGLAYILFVLGVGVWNGMYLAAFVGHSGPINQFFLMLSMVGALLAGLGWFLFASTASSTPDVPYQRIVFHAVAVIVGFAITLAITAPLHGFHWVTPIGSAAVLPTIVPKVGYFVHTAIVGGLFGAGAALFASDRANSRYMTYRHGYVVAGLATGVAVLGSNVLVPGGVTVAPLVAICLTTIGWLQAKRWSGLRLFRRKLTAV